MSLPPEASLDDVKVRIRESIKNPNVGKVEQVVLKEVPRAFRLATLYEIMDPESGALHHCSLRIESVNRRKDGWFYKPEKSVLLDGEDPDEIERLFSFLRAHLEGRFAGATGDVRIIKAEEYEKLARLVDLVPNLASPDMVELIKLILPRVDDAASYLPDFVEAFEASEPRVVEHIAVAARLVRYRLAHERLAALVEDPATTEHEYQQLLSENPWIFGSEYSELLDRRTWARDDSLDFMLRRTTDDYLEIVEIKTAFTEPLFVHDRSHDSYHPSAKLSAVLGQVMHYVSEIERSRDAILCKDGCDTLKIRARVVAGRDGGPKHQSALRTLNAHLHGIEVLTFDQLLRIARKVLDVFEGVVKADEHESGEQDRPVRPF